MLRMINMLQFYNKFLGNAKKNKGCCLCNSELTPNC